MDDESLYPLKKSFEAGAYNAGKHGADFNTLIWGGISLISIASLGGKAMGYFPEVDVTQASITLAEALPITYVAKKAGDMSVAKSRAADWLTYPKSGYSTPSWSGGYLSGALAAAALTGAVSWSAQEVGDFANEYLNAYNSLQDNVQHVEDTKVIPAIYRCENKANGDIQAYFPMSAFKGNDEQCQSADDLPMLEV